MYSMGKFQDKVAIITGASSGIGAATAIALAREGANVTITGRNNERLEKTAKLCLEAGVKVLEILCDLENFEELEQLINKTVERFSSIDILVNNAGTGLMCSVENLELEKYETLFNVNVRAPVFLCKHALPHLKKTKGCVVNVSSAASMGIPPGNILYGVSKSTLDHFTRGFAAECAQFGVRVNSVNPGMVRTNFGGRLGTDPESVKKFVELLTTRQKLGVMKPETIAEAILFLCSSSHTTGSSLLVDGGLLLPS